MSAASLPVSVDVFSDVVCPWCLIGKRRLEKAIALKPEIAVEVHYQPYFLNPWVPQAGLGRSEYLTAKFGSPQRYQAIAERVAAVARSEGLAYNIERVSRQPNTRDCHRLILWAGSIGQAAAMKQRLMDLYFTEGGDLSDPEVLVQAARDCGLDDEEVRAHLAGQTDVALVEEAAKAAQEAGIDGVPFFVFGQALAVSGAQPAEYLAAAIEQAARHPGLPQAPAN